MDFLQPLAAVGFVMALLGAALMVLKKRGAASFRLSGLYGAAPRRMEAVERLSLGPHHALHLIRLGERSIVVATGPGSLQVLGEVELGTKI
jgi:flagellar biogenesis protein FliO